MSRRKDPNKPKGKLSAYNCFIREEREAMKKSEAEGPANDAEIPEEKISGTMAQQAFMVACAEKWKKLSEEERQRFKEAAEKDKIRYENEMASYTPPKTEARGRKTRREKKMKDPNEPKRGMSSFMFFCKDVRTKMREENPQAAVSAKMLGEMWAKMEEKQKEKYEQMAKEDRERYHKEMRAFRKGDYVVPSTSQVAMEAEE